MALLDRWRRDDKEIVRPLYAAIIAEARDPDWYRRGKVPDTIDGRFDMVALLLAQTLLRLEQDGEPGQIPSVRLTEVFVDDMDGQMRETGFGDLVVGKQVGRIMSALGGRIRAYRAGIDDDALTRNLYRGVPPVADALAYVRTRARQWRKRIDALPLAALLAPPWPVMDEQAKTFTARSDEARP